MTTIDSARDMNSIRQAVAGPGGKISYYGFSYGTYLGNAWFNAPCLYWPAPARTPVRVASRGSGSAIKNALLIDETLDAATPFEGSLEVRRLFPHSVLLAEPGGTTHADSLSGDLCVDSTIATYLEHGTLPARKAHAKRDKTCKPLPRPVPTKASAAHLPASTYRSVLNQLHARCASAATASHRGPAGAPGWTSPGPRPSGGQNGMRALAPIPLACCCVIFHAGWCPYVVPAPGG